ncbi:LysR family transcriptional regulator [Salinibius halmophilus]|uniref:LysR family transcriptional regulator n=1 Tax=Salinibius halmophilus TaxID=1853216 RepID=UPI000E675971|nr:LysR family transcriptional regulator [Salinibius halmophilus]
MNALKLAPLLLIFAEVAKQKSFTGAAKKLGLSKSAISQQIKRLEDMVEMQLLARNTRGVVLTNHGEALLSRSELLTAQLHNVVQDMQHVKAQPSGEFKISVPPFLERNIVVPAIRQLCIEFPRIQPNIEITGKWRDLIDHQLDAAIFGGDLKDCAYKAQSVGRVHDVFCASSRYLQQHKPIIQLADIKDHVFIATPWQQNKTKLWRGDEEIEFELPKTAYTNSLATLVDMVNQDIGIGLLPNFVAKQRVQQGNVGMVMQNNLVQVLPELRGRDWHFFFLHRYQANKPAHVARFYELLRHYFLVATR